MKITLGVMDVPYNKRASFTAVGRKAAPRRLRRAGPSGAKTTGEVADLLEAKYGITEFFLNTHGEEFIKDILEGHAQNLARPEKGRGSRTDYLAKAIQRGEELFQTMLDNRELDGKVEGVPTMAATLGIRFGRSRQPGRPSFVDTGLYRDSFRIEAEEE